MGDLAVQAFNTNNFDLAVEIYERSIRENGPTSDLCLGLADSFARAGQFERAFTSYSNAFRLGTVSYQNLKHLVTALVETVSQDISPALAMLKHVIFDCILCRNLLSDPVTLSCGHTFCRTCLQKEKDRVCKACGTVNHNLNVSKIHTNVTLSQTIEKWFPDQCKAAKLKCKANEAFQLWKMEDAIQLYSEAIQFVPNDHLLWSNRSHALAKLDRYSEALEDAFMVIKLRPDWSKGYFRKGMALYGLNKYEETIIAMLQCLALDTSVTPAKDYLSKALHQILSYLHPEDPKVFARQQELNPSMLDNLIHANFNSSLLLPQVSVNTIRELQDIVHETVAQASNFMNGIQSDTQQQGAQALDIDVEHPSAIPSHMLSETNQRCQSAPDLRSISPTPRTERSGSSAGIQNMQFDNPTKPSQTQSTSATEDNKYRGPSVDPALLNKEDFECSLCYRTLYMPVTTPCGHSFCRQCLDRSLDHRSDCPLCKSSLSDYLAARRETVTSSLEGILMFYFKADYEQRKVQHEEELTELASMGRDNEHEIPIFVCTLAYPTVSCPLHIFEPRYRLMVRQCMESGRRQFGMCVATEEEEQFSQFGCMLEIREVQFFPDGRSLVDTIGGKRFKVLSKGQREGYDTARVEFLSDVPMQGEELTSLRARSNNLYTMCQTWFESLPVAQKQEMVQHLGQFPEKEGENEDLGADGPSWHWYMIAILPLDPRIQLAMLEMTSYGKRLDGLQRVMGFLRARRGSR